MMTDGAAETGGEDRVDRAVGVLREYERPARDQLFLMPVSMRDWLEEGHLVWFVLDVVERMDTRALHRRPAGAVGRRPYLPEMMLALVLYGYCCGVRFSRRLEAACRTDAAFRVICGGLEPDHATIARFVVDHERALVGLFVEGVRLCAAAGLVDLAVVALDGTKIAADASLQRNRDAVWIRRQVARLIELTGRDESAGDGQDALVGVAPAAENGGAGGRLARLEAALAVLEAEDAAAVEAAARHAEAAAAEAEHGRQRTGRKPKDPRAALARAEVDHAVALERVEGLHAEHQRRQLAAARGEKAAGPRLRIDRAQSALERADARLRAARDAATASASASQTNVTDPDSRIMSTNDGWVQGYNAQAIVNKHQIVLACEVSQDANDVQLYEPMNSELTRTLKAAGITTEPALILADAGYCSEHNLTTSGPDRLIATTKDWKQRRTARELGQTDGPPPPDATPIEEMEHLLRTPQGTTAYAKRSELIEPVFGDRKHNRQIRSFRRRGLSAVRSEWAFIHLAGNIRKLYHHHAATTAA
jgi:transposase